MSRCAVATCPNRGGEFYCRYHAPLTCNQRHVDMTERQRDAWLGFRAARERLAMVKAEPCMSAEQSKARWARLRDAERSLQVAQDELDASIVDEMGDDERDEQVNR